MFRYTKATALREVLVWVVTLIGLLPFYLLVVTALKPDEEVLTTSAVAPPSSIDFGAFVEVLTTTGRNSIPMSILNSVIITAGAIFGLVLLGSVAAYVIVPAIRPSIAIATTLGIIQGLRIFDQILALTGGGPAGATETLATQVYKQAFSLGQFGFGSALALVLTVIILAFAILQQYLTRDRDARKA